MAKLPTALLVLFLFSALLFGQAEKGADLAKQVASTTKAPATDPRLEAMRKQAKALQQGQTAYYKKLSEGKLQPYAHLQKELPHLKKKTAALGELWTELGELPEDSPERGRLIGLLNTTLQELGDYLEVADYADFDASLTAKQEADLRRLEEADHGPLDAAGAPALSILSPSRTYALTRLPVPLVVRATPGSTVHFRTVTGGEFSNGIPEQAVEVDATGHARTFWITRGDAIADVDVMISSPEHRNAEEVCITVVKLEVALPAALAPRPKEAAFPVKPPSKLPASKPEIPKLPLQK